MAPISIYYNNNQSEWGAAHSSIATTAMSHIAINVYENQQMEMNEKLNCIPSRTYNIYSAHPPYHSQIHYRKTTWKNPILIFLFGQKIKLKNFLVTYIRYSRHKNSIKHDPIYVCFLSFAREKKNRDKQVSFPVSHPQSHSLCRI
jgi:hypothetical protein